METFLLVLAALFSVINPPGTALVFLSMTKHASVAARRSLARRVAINSFFVMAGSLLIGALVLRLYGISVPVLRVAGGLIVASSGWKMLNEGTRTGTEATAKDQRADYSGQAFYPLTLPLTTGPGTIAVMISLGLSRTAYSDYREDVAFFLASLLATIVMAAGIFVCFAYSDRVERVLGGSGTDIAARLSAFILFCLGVQIIWTGASDLLASVQPHGIPVK
jgi:multiple antibiotic resistance protein